MSPTTVRPPTAPPVAAPAPTKPALLSPDEKRAWGRPRTAPMLVHFGLVWLQIIGALAVWLAFPNPLTFVAAFVLVGGAQHGLTMVTHEFAHWLGFPAHRRLNDLVGAWLFAGPGGVPFELYRQRHFDHHRHVSTDEDTKTIYRRDYAGVHALLELLRGLSGLDWAGQLVQVLRRHRVEGQRVRRGSKVSLLRAIVPLAGSQAIIAVVLCLIDPVTYLTLWLLPLVTVAHLFAKLRSSVEHLPLNCESGEQPDSPYFKGTAAPFSRSVRASWLERLFLCKVNFCYHDEHHLWPQVSYQYLPMLRRRRLERAGRPRESSYLSTLVRFWRGE